MQQRALLMNIFQEIRDGKWNSLTVSSSGPSRLGGQCRLSVWPSGSLPDGTRAISGLTAVSYHSMKKKYCSALFNIQIIILCIPRDI